MSFSSPRSSVALAFLALAVSGCPSTPAGPACSPACAAATQLCCATAAGTNVCVNYIIDPANCGACGNNCFGAACISGSCVATDAGPPRDGGGPPRDGGICPGGAGSRTCPGGITVNCSGFTGPVDGEGGRTDPTFTNCGVCGFACNADHHNRCATPGGGLGTPRCLCGAADCGAASGDVCTLVSGTYRCLHTDTDRMNCGAPGNVCDASEVCSGGMCVCNAGTLEICDAGETCCASACVDLTSDEGSCGACGAACAADEECITAAGGPSECLCGGVACDAAETCMAGTCVCDPATGTVCGAGESCCGTTCIDTSADDANCGGCGIACGTGESCSTVGGVTGCRCGGTAVCTPPATVAGGSPGELCCDDGSGTFACVPQDGMNCGGCGMACSETTETCALAMVFLGAGVGTCCSGDLIFGGLCPPIGP